MNKKGSRGKNVFYSPALDGLRFFAFLLVFLNHSWIGIESRNPISKVFLKSYIRNGWIGVDLFFVLSGFLITSILIKEKEEFGKVSLKYFWIRRVLRIWPLYYLAIIVFYFLTPQLANYINSFKTANFILSTNAYAQLPFYLTFLGNWGIIIYGYGMNTINLLWTVSMEQQFYLLCPIIFILLSKKVNRLLMVVVGVILVMPIIRYLFSFSSQNMYPQLIYVNTLTRMDTLFFGVMLSIVLSYKTDMLKRVNFIKHPLFFILSIVSFTAFLYRIEILNPEFKRNLAFGYSIIGLYMSYLVFYALDNKTFFSKFLSFAPFVYLGKISYGLYVWQYLTLNVTIAILGAVKHTVLLSIVVLILNIIVATCSYYLFERRFLRIKYSFEKIKTRKVF